MILFWKLFVDVVLVSASITPMNATFPDYLQVCILSSITWSGGLPPYTLVIGTTFSNSASITPIQTYYGLTSDHFDWTANVSAGTLVEFRLTDGSGDYVGSYDGTSVAEGSASCMQSSTSSSPGDPSGTNSRSNTDSAVLCTTMHAVSLTSQSESAWSTPIVSTALPTATRILALARRRMSSRIIGAIAASCTVALLGIIAFVFQLRRVMRRRRSVRVPRVDLNESPRTLGTLVPQLRDPTPPPRTRHVSTLNSSRKLTSSRRQSMVHPDSSDAVLVISRPRSLHSGLHTPTSSESDLERLHRLHTTPFRSESLYTRVPALPARRRATSASASSSIHTSPSKRRRRDRTVSMPSASEDESRAQPRARIPEEIVLEDIAGETAESVHEEVTEEVRLRSTIPRQELDGGVRLAGGPPDEMDAGSVRSVIPPPYHR